MVRQFSIMTLLLFVCSVLLAQTWQQKVNTTLKYNATAFSIGQYGYLVNGSSTRGFTADLQEFDPIRNSWTAKAPFPGSARETAVSFSYQGNAYVGLGWNNSSTFKDFYIYSQASNTWKAMSSFPGYGGRNGYAARVGDKAYVSGGAVGYSTTISNELWEFNILNDTWTQKANMPFTQRVGAVAFGTDSILYVGLGHNFSSDTKEFWAYNPSSNTWTRVADFPGVGRLQASVFEINGTFVVGGGHRYGGGLASALNDYYAYDPNTNTWSTIPRFTNGRRTRSEGFSINGRGYLVCGSDNRSTFLNDTWEYSHRISVSIEESKESISNRVIIYPNPAKDQFIIRYSGKPSNFQLRILNTIGAIVREETIQLSKADAKIDFSALKTGNYYYQLNNQEESYSGIIVKTN